MKNCAQMYLLSDTTNIFFIKVKAIQTSIKLYTLVVSIIMPKLSTTKTGL